MFAGCEYIGDKARRDELSSFMADIVNAPTIGGWISVEDRLPETEYDYFGHSTGESHDVLIYMENENYSESRILVGRYSILFSYWPQEDRANGWRVTHWMPLPSTEGLDET